MGTIPALAAAASAGFSSATLDDDRLLKSQLPGTIRQGTPGPTTSRPLPLSPSLNASAASGTQPAPPQSYRVTMPPTLVHLKDLQTPSGVSPSRRPPPLMHLDTSSYAAPLGSDTARREGVVSVGASQPGAASATTPFSQKLAGGPLMDLSRQVTLYGIGQQVEPPDTQLAAGSTTLVEADNSTLSLWSKSTGALRSTFDLNTFFSVPSTFGFGDPRLLYDAWSGRWFLTGLAASVASTSNDSKLYMAVSTTSDPAGPWNIYLLGSWAGVLADQPMTGVTDDKIVISWNDYSGTSSSTARFSGEETWVLQKSDLVSGVAARIVAFGPDINRFRIVPAQSLSSTTTAWLAYNNASCSAPPPPSPACNRGVPTVGIVAINGTPATANVTWTESDPAIVATNVPPDPRQPGVVPVDQGLDARFISAVWQNGIFWVSGNDACRPAGDTLDRTCLRLIEVSTGSPASVMLDVDAALNGFDLYYPAVTLNSSGDLFFAYSQSSATMYPSAMASASLAATPTSFDNPSVLASGLNSYVSGGPQRWGDYSGAAQDSVNSADVWLAAEYQASATNAANWGTATARMAIRPAIVNISPNSGPVNGQQPVVITGTHFQAGASVSFGAAAATNVVVVSATQINATTPSATGPGAVSVTVNQPDGTSGTQPSAYTYVLPPAVTGISPRTGAAVGGTVVTVTGTDFVGVSAVKFGAIQSATFTVNSPTQITAMSPPGAGTVDIAVTASGGASAISSADQFKYLPSVAVLPAMANAAYGGYTTVAQIQNVGSMSSSVEIRYFDSNGVAAGTGDSIASLPVNGTWIVRQDVAGHSFPAGGAGSAVIYSSQPVASFVNEFAPGNVGDATSYTGINSSGIGLTLYAPTIVNNAYGGYTTGIGLVNVGTAATNLTITYRDGSGALIKTQTLNGVAAGAYQGVYSGDATLALPAGFAGTATIVSSAGAIAAIVNETGPGGQFSSYDAVPLVSTTLYAPVALNNAYGGYYTGMGIQNTTGTAGTVTINYYDGAGTATTKTFPIAANGSLGVYQGSLTDGPVPGAYTAKFTSTVAIAAIVNEVAPSTTSAKQSTAYNTFAAGAGTLHLPLVESAGSDGWSTGEGIMNTGSAATTVTVNYYDIVTGALVGTPQSQVLQPNAFWGLYQPTGGLPSGTRASAVIKTSTSGQVAVICNESNATTFMSYGAQ